MKKTLKYTFFEVLSCILMFVMCYKKKILFKFHYDILLQQGILLSKKIITSTLLSILYAHNKLDCFEFIIKFIKFPKNLNNEKASKSKSAQDLFDHQMKIRVISIIFCSPKKDLKNEKRH